jgi:hypothetical protein
MSLYETTFNFGFQVESTHVTGEVLGPILTCPVSANRELRMLAA